MTSETDRIERRIVLKAPVARVWRAISDAKEFGTWFRVALDARFEPGARVTGKLTFPGYEGTPFEVRVDRIEPQELFSFRWHPYAIEKGVDYSREPTTLVEFRLAPHRDGTELTIVESGFDALPEARRATAFRMNGDGWNGQIRHIEAHVAA